MGVNLTATDWAKLITIVLLVVVVGIAVLVKLTRAGVKTGKLLRDVRREAKRREREALPEARLRPPVD